MDKTKFPPIILFAITLVGLINCTAMAQTIPDQTLGSENSTIKPEVIINDKITDLVEGGAIRDNNLFHSFREFNVGDSESVYFANPDGIANILTRVTGDNVSEIFGTLGVDGGANLFLLNPNGIVFGENAALDLNGSFFATTGDSYIFENDFAYSASNPDTPPLLTVNLPVGVQFGTKAAAIVNQSFNFNDFDEPAGLEVFPENNLTFVGGDVLFEGGVATASNGFIEVGSVAPSSLVKIMPTENHWTLDYTEVSAWQDINLTQAARIDSSGSGGGNIHLQGREITIQDGSTIHTDSYGEDDPGMMRINATEKLNIFGSTEEDSFLTGLYADAISGGEGNDIAITTQQLVIAEGGIIRAEVFDTGNGGNISLQAENIAVTTATFPFSVVSTRVNEDATGQGGNVSIQGSELLIENSVLVSDTFGAGDAGSVEIEVDDLRVIAGGFLATATLGSGKGGDILVTAKEEVEISGVDADGFPSTLSAVAYDIGQGGNIIINADKLSVTDDAIIDASTFHTADSGDIEIDVRQLIIKNDASQIAVATTGEGDGGNLIVRASESIEISGTRIDSDFDGEDSADLIFSGLLATVDPFAQGNGGNLIIETGNLNIFDGGVVVASTLGEGNAGDISIRANNLEIKNAVANPRGNHSGIHSAVTTSGIGDGGDIEIIAQDVSLIDGGLISVDSLGAGDAGSVNIQAQNINIAGVSSGEPILGIPQEPFPSSISAFASGDFTAGSVNINSNSLNLNNRGNIAVSNLGNGDSGNLNLTVAELNLDNFATLEAEVSAGSQGNINLATDNIFLSNGSEITAQATGSATGGSISINNVDNLVLAQNSQIIANAIAGDGGNIDIITQGYFISADSLITASSEFGLDGNVEVETINGDRPIELDKLPVALVDVSQQITQTCRVGDHHLAIAGNGGLPENPTQNLRGQSVWQDLRLIVSDSIGNRDIQNTDIHTQRNQSAPSVVEAQAWKVNKLGKIELTASNFTPHAVDNSFSCKQ